MAEIVEWSGWWYAIDSFGYARGTLYEVPDHPDLLAELALARIDEAAADAADRVRWCIESAQSQYRRATLAKTLEAWQYDLFRVAPKG